MGANGQIAGPPKKQQPICWAPPSCSTKRLLPTLLIGEEPVTSSTDPMLVLARAGQKRFEIANRQMQQVNARQTVLRSQLGRYVYDVYGNNVPPDATFSLRINDGIVKGYPYNGTVAPIITTFAGLYDRNYSFGDKYPWSLPARWKNPPAELLKQPMCFITTNDIIGGNSGSPMINKNREAVGLVFDGNMESLPGSFIFVPEKNPEYFGSCGRNGSRHAVYLQSWPPGTGTYQWQVIDWRTCCST